MGIGARIEVEQKKSEHTDSDKENLVTPKFSLSDLIIPKETSSSIADFLAYKKHEELIFGQWGLSKTHNHHRQTAINFYGMPGTGKTMAAHAIAKELNQSLIMVDYASLESKYVGETSKNIAEIFRQAKAQQAIIFFDEADAILSRRVTNMSHATDVSVNQTRSVLLTLMNDYQGLIIFTTNFIENYDPAFMRRILAHIRFDLPDFECRMKLWQQYIPDALPHEVEINILAKISETLSGSDISNCVLKAAMSAARQDQQSLQLEHFKQAIDEVLKSKAANLKKDVKIEKRIVSEEYVKSKIGDTQMQEMKA
ncbi:AAA family ATPase [Serratia sp. S1B]|nr:AAA family ATPase [Serratia sp. S1B]